MWDLPEDECTNKLAAQVFENDGVVCAVCHGTAGKIDMIDQCAIKIRHVRFSSPIIPFIINISFLNV